MIKKILFTGFVLSLFFFNTLAQSPTFEWAKSVGAIYYDYGYDVALDGSGNVYTTGYFQGTVDFDPGSGVFNLTSAGSSIFVSKLDALGNFVWAKAISGTGSSKGNAITLDPTGTGSVYITGNFNGTIDFDPGTGVFNLTSVGENNDAFICKLDGSGTFVWAKQIGGTGYKSGLSIALDLTGNGDICISGRFNETVDFDPGSETFNLTSIGENHDIFICKLDSLGTFIWAKQLGGSGLKRSSQLTIDPDGNIYTIGWFEGTVDFDPDSTNTFNLTSITNYDIFISKLDNSGNFVWAKQLGGAGFNKGMSIVLNPSGNGDIYITGAFQGTVDFDPGLGVFYLTSVGDFDIFISKLSSSGNFVWAKAMGGSSYEFGFSIALDPLGNIYTTGYFRGISDFNPDPSEIFNLTSIGNDDIFISKLNSMGSFVWAKQIGGTGDDYGLSLTLDTLGELFMTGVYYSPTITFDLITLTNTFSGGYTCDIFITKLKPIISEIESEKKVKSFIVYPNPVTNNLFIIFSGKKQKVEVTITDITGKIVRSTKLKSNTINVGDLPNGIYFIKFEGENNTIPQKFIKQ